MHILNDWDAKNDWDALTIFYNMWDILAKLFMMYRSAETM